MKLRFILAVLAVLASTHARADDADDCVKTTGDTRIAACTRAIESGRWQGANLSWAYNNRGIAKRGKGDLDGAIADYNRAIELNPQSTKAYINRGVAKRGKGHVDGAIADYKRAIELNPQDARAYVHLGEARRVKGDPDGAIVDFNRALKIDPQYARAYGARGAAKRAKGDLDGAIADFTRTIEIDPHLALAYKARGRTRYYKGEFALATTDLARSLELKPDAYTPIWLFLARTRSGSDGKNEFVTDTTKLDTAKWPAPVTTLYLGKGTPASVLSGAENPDPKTRQEQVCEANFYVGQWHLLKGNRTQALASLRTARDQCPKNFVEYTGAVYELKRFGVQ